jgi:hypothetical protein
MKKVIRLTESDLKRIVRRVLNEDVDPTTPTGVPSKDGYDLILDKNDFLGIYDGDRYRLTNADPVFKNYNTTKKIPNGVDYQLIVNRTFTGDDGVSFDVYDLDHQFLKIKDGKLIGDTWEAAISRFLVSIYQPNNLTSDKNNIFRSLIQNKDICFEIDKLEPNYINFVGDGIVNKIVLYLKSKCDKTITSASIILNNDSSELEFYINDKNVNGIWNGKDLKFEKSVDNTSKLIIVEPPNDEVIPKPNDEVIPKPNNNVTPTGVADSSGEYITLDKNSSLGILDGGEYRLWNNDPVFKNYNTTKKIPNGVDYYLNVKKTIDGINVDIYPNGYLTIKDGKLIGNTWEDLFSKFNKVSFNSSNDLLFDEDYIFQSLLKNKVPCFEIDKEENNSIQVDVQTGVINEVTLYLKSKCDEKITSCYLTLNSSDGVIAGMNGEIVNVIWNGKDLKFEKSDESKLIIKVNESIRKILRSYFYS